MLKLIPSDSSSPDWRQCLRPRRRVLKVAKRTKPNNNNGGAIILKKKKNLQYNHVLQACRQILFSQSNGSDGHGATTDGFESSHGSSWFRGPLLGEGGFGSVFLATATRAVIDLKSLGSPDSYLPSEMAVKSSFLEHSSSLHFERKVLEELNCCPNVVKCYGDEITKTRSGKPLYNLLLEYCSGGCLLDRIAKFGPKGLPELEVRRYTRDIVVGIAYIHGRGFIHCDIKPENVLLLPSSDDGAGCLVAKIADFGLAEKMTDDEVSIGRGGGIKGTVPYMAPELVRDHHSDWPIDIWAVGCVVLEMLTGKGVWSRSSILTSDDLLARIACSDQLPEIPSGLSAMATDFLRRCLLISPYARSPASLLLHHPFISLPPSLTFKY